MESVGPFSEHNCKWPQTESSCPMMPLHLNLKDTKTLKILCLVAHSDDIEIGCGGTILRLADQYPTCEIYWAVFNAIGRREAEARHGAQLFAGSRLRGPILKEFQDGFMPYVGSEVKGIFEREIKQILPDLVFTHNGKDAHQDHRLISELTWNTFRNHLILEYEIPKYDGDFGRPGLFVPLEKEVCDNKVAHLMGTFQSQLNKHWFQPDTFLSLMRLRGMECAAASGYAEAFYCRKLVM